MDEKTKKKVIEFIEKDEPLPFEYETELFPTTKKEYELKYAGKEREEVILNDTMAVPFQAVKHFGKVKEGEWANMLIFGDNLQALKHLLKLKEEGKLRNPDGKDGVKLVYIDPPFATKQEFSGSKYQKAYADKIQGAEFIEFLRKRLLLIREIMTDDGSIYLHLDTKKSHYLKIIMDELFGESNFVNEIVWKRTAAHNDPNRFGAIHDSVLYYSKGEVRVWREQRMEIDEEYKETFLDNVDEKTGKRYARIDLTAPSHGSNAGRFEWQDITPPPSRMWANKKEVMDQWLSEGRIHFPKSGIPRFKRFEDEFDGSVLQDVWTDIRPIHNQSTERVGYPTQKPESLLERIITASSNEGDIVLDCFAGAGTTGIVADKMKRRWVMVDCGKLALYTIQKRLINLKESVGDKGKPLKHKPFTLYHAGLYYDGELLHQMQSADYKEFVLELFSCQKRDHKINGLPMQGTLNNHSVMVFDKENFLTYEFIDDLHKTVGSSVKDQLYLIAPVGVVGFNEDYVTRGKNKYVVLRIPNSIIEHIREKNFTKLKQPRSIADINETIDAVGFDFVYPPTVKAKYYTEKPKGKLIDLEYVVEIKEFEPVQLGANVVEFKDPKAESLAMVMVDFNYDGETFKLGKYFFGDEIAKNGFRVTWSEDIGDKVMIVYVDIFGNEKREVISKKDFVRG